MLTLHMERSLLDVTLTPHRSLSPRAIRLFLLVFFIVSAAFSLPFLLLGAWPVAGFIGLDVLILAIAFFANHRAARSTETIYVSAIEMRIAKTSAKGDRSEWKFHPWWTRLTQEFDDDFGLLRLAWVSRGTVVEVAACLGPVEKQAFAGLLSKAMADARRPTNI